MLSGGLTSFTPDLTGSTTMSFHNTIAVIGAGFSGTMLAIHLSRALPSSARILLIERTGTYARGIAYADDGASHLLNVRAANMSAFPDDPDHFARWLLACPDSSRGDLRQSEAGLFATRRLYGRYLQEALAGNLDFCKDKMQFLTAEVEEIERSGRGWRLGLRGGKQIEVSGVVLACGNLPPEQPGDGMVFHNPWAADALRGLNKSDPVLIVGTGLTMVDLALGLQGTGFEGRVIALSRRGLLPQPHAASVQTWSAPNFTAAERASVTALLRAVRAQVHLASAAGVGWRAVIDSLRPITAKLWHGLPHSERKRFLRHLRPYWDTHRHRTAPSVAATLAGWQAQDRLRVMRGRIFSIRHGAGNKADVSISSSIGGEIKTLHVQRVIYATGLQAMRSGSGLLDCLLRDGLARPDALALGLDVDDKLNILDTSGRPAMGLWALGPLVRGVFWECVAVPDIRLQAQQLSLRIAEAMREQARLKR